MATRSIKYTNGETTVVWQPDLCTHSGICARGLIQVFDPSRKKWIDMSQSDTNTIVEQVKKCPSGALSYFMNEEEK